MAYQIVYKKRFVNKLLKLLDYLKREWSGQIADDFIVKLQNRLQTLSGQPYIGAPSTAIQSVRSILVTRQNRVFYRIKDNVIEEINMYDTRSNPKRNPYK